jgi:hypothetical protein
LIPESPFYLEGEGGLLRYIEKRLKDNGHMVIVVAEGAGQNLIAETMQSIGKDASGNELLLDVGLWLSQKINVRTGPSALFSLLLALFCIQWHARLMLSLCIAYVSLSSKDLQCWYLLNQCLRHEFQEYFKKTKMAINLKYIGQRVLLLIKFPGSKT